VASLDLSGKKAIVTGASSGIGAATARALADAGVAVAGGARRVERLETAIALPLDVRDDRDIAELHGAGFRQRVSSERPV